MKPVGSIYPNNARFASLGGWPCVYTEHPPEGWWRINGKWRENWAEIVCAAGMLSRADFDAWFGELPPLPPDAFQPSQ